MGYVVCPYTPAEWRDILNAAQKQIVEMQLAISQVRRMERYAAQTPPKPGYDIFPINADANAAMQALMNAKWANILGGIGSAASLSLFRYKYVIAAGKPAAYLTATITDFGGVTRITPNAGSPFWQVVIDDRITLTWVNANGVTRTKTGLIVSNTSIILTTQEFPDLVVNGDMDPDSNWTKGAGWTIAGGVADAAGALNTALTSAAAITVVVGRQYTLTYTMTRAAGTLTPSFDGVPLTARALSGTYSEDFSPADTSGVLAFTGTGFTGTLDDVTFHETQPVADASIVVTLKATNV